MPRTNVKLPPESSRRLGEAGVRLQVEMLTRLFSGDILRPIMVAVPDFWYRVIEGVHYRSMHGDVPDPRCRWSYVRCRVLVEDEDIVLIGRRELSRAYASGRACGILEWVELSAADARVVLASVPGGDGTRLMIYGDHEEALLRIHTHCEALGYTSRRAPDVLPAEVFGRNTHLYALAA